MTTGEALFARFAFPPNQLGLCGPDDSAFLAEVAAGGDYRGVHQVLQGFTGAYPYLRLIAEQSGTGNPLDPHVVEAYWLGHGAVTGVDLLDFGNHLRDRFRPALGTGWMSFADSLEQHPHPTHAFHVFGVYPWLGKLRDGMVEPSLRILDRCRVRWGDVLEVDGHEAVVRSTPLEVTNEGRLSLGAPMAERVHLYSGLHARPGHVVALHWDWACAVLDRARQHSLQRDTQDVLTAIPPLDPTR